MVVEEGEEEEKEEGKGEEKTEVHGCAYQPPTWAQPSAMVVEDETAKKT